MVSGYEVGMYRDIALIAQALRGIEEKLALLEREVGRLADAQKDANEES